MNDNIDYCKKCKCRYIRTKEDYNRLGEPLKCCSKCRIRNSKRPKKKSIIETDDTDTKKISIDKADENDDNKNIVLEDKRKFNSIRNIVEFESFFDKLGHSIKYKCIDCGVKYILGDDDFDEVGEPYETCSKCVPRPILNRKLGRCLEHSLTTKKKDTETKNLPVWKPDSESD